MYARLEDWMIKQCKI